MNWLTIKNFGKVKYFNISYAALLVVPIFIDVATRLRGTWIELPIPDSVRLIYMASFLYAFGIAIYQYSCPAIIKNYDKIQDYIRDNYDIFLKAYPDLKYHIVSANLETTQKETITKLQQLRVVVDGGARDKKEELEALMDSMLPSCVQNYLTKEFNEALITHRFWMFLSFLFYISGTLIILYLLIKKSFIVFNL